MRVMCRRPITMFVSSSEGARFIPVSRGTILECRYARSGALIVIADDGEADGWLATKESLYEDRDKTWSLVRNTGGRHDL